MAMFRQLRRLPASSDSDNFLFADHPTRTQRESNKSRRMGKM
jgi:hypothetical protein